MKHFLVFLAASLTVLILKGQEWDPELTEEWDPVPRTVTPGIGSSPPSDAIILFDGTGLDKWMSMDSGSVQWQVEDGIMTIVPGTGYIQTRQAFGDIQLHIEWRTPVDDKGPGQFRGNSGIYLQTLYEVQVLDSYENKTYPNGQAGAIYKQYIPLVNACRPPGEWQTYDIIFTAPRFNEDGTLFSSAKITVLHNGVLIQNHVRIEGPTEFIGRPKYKPHDLKMPLLLQDHGDLVSYRNIWIREL